MARLAFLGHKTRSKEIIELLKMFGAQHGIYGIGHYPIYPHMIYYINGYNLIEACDRMHHLEYAQYSLEEFLENFPFKVGDKVLINDDKNDVYTVKSMEWNEDFNRVAYRIEAVDGIMHDHTWFAHEMHAAVSFNTKKEETVKEKGDKAKAPNLIGEDYSGKRYVYKIPNGYDFHCVINDEIILKPKQPQYPKTYEECCGVLKIPNDERYIDIDVPLGYNKLLSTFTKLLICRDAYWKIAGEQKGLNKPWEPDWLDTNTQKYCIYYVGNEIKKQPMLEVHHFLAFPTAEMRDAFYENFKDLIESCKELL